MPAAPRAAEWAECREGRGRRGGALPGPWRGEVRPLLGRARRGRGVGGTRRLGLGTRLLAQKMLILIPARPFLLPGGGANPSGSGRHPGPTQRPGRAHAATPSLAPLFGIPFVSGRIRRPLLREAFPDVSGPLPSPGVGSLVCSTSRYRTGTEGLFSKRVRASDMLCSLPVCVTEKTISLAAPKNVMLDVILQVSVFSTIKREENRLTR